MKWKQAGCQWREKRAVIPVYFIWKRNWMLFSTDSWSLPNSKYHMSYILYSLLKKKIPGTLFAHSSGKQWLLWIHLSNNNVWTVLDPQINITGQTLPTCQIHKLT